MIIHIKQKHFLRAVSIFVVLFVIATTVSSNYAGTMLFTRLAGVVLAAVGLFCLRKAPVGYEVILYGLFVLWSAISGFIVASNISLLLDYVVRVVQIWLLMLSITRITYSLRNTNIVFLSMIICATVISLIGWLSGDFFASFNKTVAFRATSYLRNPNSLAYFSLIAIMGVALYWKQVSRGRHLILGLLCIVFVANIIFSGSRKSFFGLLFFVGLWLWFCYSKIIFKNVLRMAQVLLLVLAVYLLVQYVINSTYLGIRLVESLSDEQILGVNRTILYQEGWRIFFKNPVAGIGLGNFQVLSSLQSYSHSDYMEILSTTGLIGFVFYFLIYPKLIVRIWRLRALRIKDIDYQLGVFLACILTFLFLAISRINGLDVLTMFILSGIVGCSYYYERAYLT